MSIGNQPSRLARQIVTNPVLMLLSSWLFGSLILSLIGPFGTFTVLNPVGSLAFWFSVTALAIILLGFVMFVTRRVFGAEHSRFFFDAIQTPMFAVLYIEPLHRLIIWHADGAEVFDKPATAFVIIVTTLLLIGVREVIIALRQSGARSSRAVRVETAESAPCPLTDRLPQGAERDIWAVTSQNHHVIVRGRTRECTVLLRFSDALRALANRQGIQVHRSHWVADEAVAAWMRDGHRLTLVLHDGHSVPVSKTFIEAVQARWPDKERLQEAA